MREMHFMDWVSLAACVGHLCVAILVLSRRTRSPLSLPLTLLSLDLFTWNFASLAYHFTHQIPWHLLDVHTSPFTPPLALHVITAFVGRLRELKKWIVFAYVAFVGLSLSQLFPGVHAHWSTVYIVMILPTSGGAVWLLVKHLRTTSDESERGRTRALFAALAIATSLAIIDLMVPYDTPLSSIGTLISSSLVAVVVLRLRLLGRALSASVAVYALLVAVLGVMGYLAVYKYLSANWAALVLGTTSITLVLVAAVREIASSYASARERVARLASMGRFASQLAHDLKNPIAALKGALQFLKEEHVQGRSLEEHAPFLDLMLEQVSRLHRVVDEYQRLGRVEPARTSVKVNDIVERVVTLQPFASDKKVNVETSLSASIPDCKADPDLLAGALENLLRNAIEAMPEGGTIKVRTEQAPSGELAVSVQDSGVGMDARQREHAFDDFFTTKPTGSGLGLAFVRRVAQAHGGDVSLTSQVGQGTTVTLRIPFEP